MSKKEEVIKLKIEKAKALISEIDILMENKFYNTAISRLYYGCFHITKAFLLTKDIISKTHSGTGILLHQHFVKVGLFDSEHAAFFKRPMNERIDDDYNDFLITSEEDVMPYIDPAKAYYQYIHSLINATIGTAD